MSSSFTYLFFMFSILTFVQFSCRPLEQRTSNIQSDPNQTVTNDNSGFENHSGSQFSGGGMNYNSMASTISSLENSMYSPTAAPETIISNALRLAQIIETGQINPGCSDEDKEKYRRAVLKSVATVIKYQVSVIEKQAPLRAKISEALQKKQLMQLEIDNTRLERQLMEERKALEEVKKGSGKCDTTPRIYLPQDYSHGQNSAEPGNSDSN